VFALAPALAPALDVASVKAIEIPVFILLGQQDKVAVPAGNGLALKPLLSHVEVETLPGVGHYDFLALCTEAGKVAAANYCRTEAPQDRTHDEAIRAAVGFFRRTLR
jgi:pimeloyl-ACP methyl ester carboxylesterase